MASEWDEVDPWAEVSKPSSRAVIKTEGGIWPSAPEASSFEFPKQTPNINVRVPQPKAVKGSVRSVLDPAVVAATTGLAAVGGGILGLPAGPGGAVGGGAIGAMGAKKLLQTLSPDMLNDFDKLGYEPSEKEKLIDLLVEGAGGALEGLIPAAAIKYPLAAANKKLTGEVASDSFMKSVRAAQKYNPESELMEIAPKVNSADLPINSIGSVIRGDEALLKAKSELGTTANTIPSSIFQPTSTSVKAGQELGVQSRLAPNKIIQTEAPEILQKEKDLLDLISRAEATIKNTETQLKNTQTASKVTGIKDSKTEDMLGRIKSSAQSDINRLKGELKTLKASSPLKQAPPLQEPTIESGFLKTKWDEGKEKLRNIYSSLAPMDSYLDETGNKELVGTVREAVRQKSKFLSNYMTTFRQIKKEFDIHDKSGILIAKILNGDEALAAQRPDLREAAKQLRMRVFDPIHQEIAKDPELSQLIGPVGYIKDYFPHMQATWGAKLKDPELVQMMIHDLKPSGLKSAFWKSRSVDSALENASLDDVFEAYLHGSAKTKFDLLAYNKGNFLASSIKDAPIKEKAAKYLRDYIGQPSSRALDREFAHGLQKFYYRSLIGGNPMSAAVNLTQTYFNTYTVTGGSAAKKGIKAVLADWRGVQAEARAAGVLEGMPDITDDAIGAVMRDSRDLTGKKVGKLADDVLFSMFKMTEQFNRMVAFKAGQSKYMDAAQKLAGNKKYFTNIDGVRSFVPPKSLIDAAEKAGWETARKTQFMYGKASPSAFSQIPLIGQFSSYPLKQADFIKQVLKSGDAGQIRRLLGTYGAATAGAGVIANKKGKSPLGAAAGVAGDFIPGPSIGPAIKDLIKIQQYMYNVQQGKVAPQDIPEDLWDTFMRVAPVARQITKYNKEDQ